MITVNVHAVNGALVTGLPVSAISDVIANPQELLWVDIVDPTPEDLAVIEQEFGFHQLAMEDAARHNQRPKIDTYDTFFFLVFYGLQNGTSDTAIEPVELNLFIGRNYVVTVHHGHLNVLEETSNRWRGDVSRIGHSDAGILVYSILDAIVDGYFPIIDHISDRIEELEESLFGKYENSLQEDIFRLKRDLLTIRRILSPQRDVMNMLVRRESPLFDAETIVYFQDIYDHILRVTDAIDTYRDLISTALDTYVSVQSNNLNQVMKRMTAASIILMSMALVTGVYGMNFQHMPELNWGLGYFLALALMVGIGSALFRVFRKIDYL